MVRMSEATFLSSDGKTPIRYREYLPETEAKAIVQIAHGIAEHIERYDAFARFLAENGFIVVLNDHLGHGTSILAEEDMGYFSDECGWNLAVEDMHTLHVLSAARFPGKSYYLFGHSMGSFLSRTYIIRYQTGLDGVILSGTGHQPRMLIKGGLAVASLEAKRKGSRYKSRLLYDMAFGSYNKGIVKLRTNCDWLSRDEAVVDAYIADPRCGWIPSVGMYADMFGGIDFITRSQNMKKMKKTLPVHFMSGDKDPVGENGKGVIRAYQAFRKAGMKDVTVQFYPKGRHEMLNEINRDEVYDDILKWLNGKCGK